MRCRDAQAEPACEIHESGAESPMTLSDSIILSFFEFGGVREYKPRGALVQILP